MVAAGASRVVAIGRYNCKQARTGRRRQQRRPVVIVVHEHTADADTAAPDHAVSAPSASSEFAGEFMLRAM